MLTRDTHERLDNAEILITVPPFAGIDRPALGPHILQSCARSTGHNVFVLYLNILFAARIGFEQYDRICHDPTTHLLGERLFARAAHGRDPNLTATALFHGNDDPLRVLRSDNLERCVGDLERCVGDFLADWSVMLSSVQARVIGASTTFEQTNAAISLLKVAKTRRPTVCTILGGANCDGDMAFGLAEIAPEVDHIFSGEAEEAFTLFCRNFDDLNERPPRVIKALPVRDLNSLPTPDFADFYEQSAALATSSSVWREHRVWLPYESSRGCWWGQKQHCTFCGINGNSMSFRQKSSSRVIDELSMLVLSHPTRLIAMVDNIMPISYFKDLLPRIAHELPPLEIFYEQKANLTLEKVRILKTAGVNLIQPGIESISTPFLKLMRKGVSASQNIALLRYCRCLYCRTWNLQREYMLSVLIASARISRSQRLSECLT